MPFVVLQIGLATVPYLVLAVAGIILFNRKRNLPAALVALGFAIIAITQIYGAILALALLPALPAPPPRWAYALLRWGATPSQWALTIGSWFAAAGLMWHALGHASASPNNRWRGP